MKFSKFGVITLLLFGMVIALTGIVYADQVVPAVLETQALSTVTIADVDGLAMETDAGTWTLNGGGPPWVLPEPDDPVWIAAQSPFSYQAMVDAWGEWMNGNGVPPGYDTSWQSFWNYWKSHVGGYEPPVYDYAVNNTQYPPLYYTTAYDADILAQAGHTVLTKSMNINTGNRVLTQSSLNAQTGLTYVATGDGGNIVGSENLMLDGVGKISTPASDRILCPFAAFPADAIPAYCTIIQTGSKYDLTIGSVTTNANERFVGSDATDPVVLKYDISVRPFSTADDPVPAVGSTSAYIKAHVQESRADYANITDYFGNPYLVQTTPAKAEDLAYSETSSANGYIYSFNKVIAYQSGKSLL